MNKLVVMLGLFMSFGFLAACADQNEYPITGEECGPDDPVKDLDATDVDCLPSL